MPGEFPTFLGHVICRAATPPCQVWAPIVLPHRESADEMNMQGIGYLADTHQIAIGEVDAAVAIGGRAIVQIEPQVLNTSGSVGDLSFTQGRDALDELADVVVPFLLQDCLYLVLGHGPPSRVTLPPLPRCTAAAAGASAQVQIEDSGRGTVAFATWSTYARESASAMRQTGGVIGAGHLTYPNLPRPVGDNDYDRQVARRLLLCVRNGGSSRPVGAIAGSPKAIQTASELGSTVGSTTLWNARHGRF